MKPPAQQAKGVAEKKPRSAVLPLMGAAVTTQTAVETVQARPAFGSAAVWTRYIDSRMKQFSTR